MLVVAFFLLLECTVGLVVVQHHHHHERGFIRLFSSSSSESFDPRVSPHEYGGGEEKSEAPSFAEEASRPVAFDPDSFDPRVSPHDYGGKNKVGVIIVDHGSRRAASNERLEALCAKYQATHAREQWVVRPAHMELAAPSIEDAFESCVQEGCDFVVCHPFFLGPGRHVEEDIPELLEAANAKHPEVKLLLTDPLGSHPAILDLVHESIVKTVEDKTEEDSFDESFLGSIQKAMELQQQRQDAAPAQ